MCRARQVSKAAQGMTAGPMRGGCSAARPAASGRLCENVARCPAAEMWKGDLEAASASTRRLVRLPPGGVKRTEAAGAPPRRAAALRRALCRPRGRAPTSLHESSRTAASVAARRAGVGGGRIACRCADVDTTSLLPPPPRPAPAHGRPAGLFFLRRWRIALCGSGPPPRVAYPDYVVLCKVAKCDF